MGNYGINMNKQLVFVAPIYKVYPPSIFFSGWAAPTSQKLVPRFTESHSCLGVKHYGNQGIPSEYPALCHQPGRSWKVLVRRSAPRQFFAPITALCLALSTPGTVGVVHDVAMFGSTPVVSSGCMPVATANFFS